MWLLCDCGKESLLSLLCSAQPEQVTAPSYDPATHMHARPYAPQRAQRATQPSGRPAHLKPIPRLPHFAVGPVPQLDELGNAIGEERADHVLDGVRGVGAEALQVGAGGVFCRPAGKAHNKSSALPSPVPHPLPFLPALRDGNEALLGLLPASSQQGDRQANGGGDASGAPRQRPAHRPCRRRRHRCRPRRRGGGASCHSSRRHSPRCRRLRRAPRARRAWAGRCARGTGGASPPAAPRPPGGRASAVRSRGVP